MQYKYKYTMYFVLVKYIELNHILQPYVRPINGSFNLTLEKQVYKLDKFSLYIGRNRA